MELCIEPKKTHGTILKPDSLMSKLRVDTWAGVGWGKMVLLVQIGEYFPGRENSKCNLQTFHESLSDSKYLPNSIGEALHFILLHLSSLRAFFSLNTNFISVSSTSRTGLTI